MAITIFVKLAGGIIMAKGITVSDLSTILGAKDLALLGLVKDLCAPYYANTFYNKAHYIYLKNPKSTLLLQAHVDTVRHKNTKLELKRFRNILFNGNGILGADDRLGVWIALQVLNVAIEQKLPIPNIIFTNGEETGSTGMKTLCKQIVAKQVNHIELAIALDRRGSTEYVTYNDLPKEVATYIETFGWIEHTGSYSDISVFTDTFSVPSVNISIGYYNQHTANEQIHLDEADLAIRRLVNVVKEPIDKLYPSVKKVTTYNNYYDNRYISYYDKGKGWWEEDDKTSAIDWVYTEKDREFLKMDLIRTHHGVWSKNADKAKAALKELDEAVQNKKPDVKKSQKNGMVKCGLCKTDTKETSLTCIKVEGNWMFICKVCLAEVQAAELRERIEKKTNKAAITTLCQSCGLWTTNGKISVLFDNTEWRWCNKCIIKYGADISIITDDETKINLNSPCDVTKCEICLATTPDVRFWEDHEMTLCKNCYDITATPDKYYRQED
jgi:hypothetical protein